MRGLSTNYFDSIMRTLSARYVHAPWIDSTLSEEWPFERFTTLSSRAIHYAILSSTIKEKKRSPKGVSSKVVLEVKAGRGPLLEKVRTK